MADDPEVTDPRDPYRRPDIVTELDRQLLHWHEPMLQRARDEIVALRQRDLDQQEALKAAISVYRSTIRHEALEEAARVCEGGYTTGSTASTLKAIAAAIRARKEKRDE